MSWVSWVGWVSSERASEMKPPPSFFWVRFELDENAFG